MSEQDGLAAVRKRAAWRPPPAAPAGTVGETPPAVVAAPEPNAHSTPAPPIRVERTPDPLNGLADEVTTVQLTVRIRPSVERRLARCLHSLGEVGLRRPSRAEIVESYLASLPEEPGGELDQLIQRLREFRARAPRP